MNITNEELLDIIAEASYRLHKEIKSAHKNGFLEGYLASINMIELMPAEKEQIYDTDPEGKILIIGESNIREDVIYGCLKEFGITKDRLELHLEYEQAKKFDFRKVQYQPRYRLILFGPIPHSGKGKEDKSSIITTIETTDGYPKAIRLTDDHGLKITKAGLKEVIACEIKSGYLAV